jgi:hypothetical protein
MPTGDVDKETDDVSGAAVAAEDELPDAPDPEPGLDPDAIATALPQVDELASACVRYIASRYGVTLDFDPDTLSFVDQWVRDARADLKNRAEVIDLVQSAAGAYLGEVVRRQLGARWFAEGDPSGWRLYLSTVYCAFNPIGMVREALLLEPAEGWHAHFELDPGEKEAIEARLDALPQVEDEEYYLPSTRYDVVSIVFDALREGLRARGLADVRFTPDDYA